MATYQQRGDRVRAIVRRKGYPVRSKSFDRKGDAVKWARKVEGEIDQGIPAPSKESVATLLKRYHAEVSPKKPSWVYEDICTRSLLKQRWTELPAAECHQHLANWIAHRLKTVQGATVNRQLNFLSAVFTRAMKYWGVALHKNPVSLVVRPPKSKNRNTRVPASDVQTFWTLRRGRERTVRWYMPIMFEFSVETGLRLGEVCALEREDIHEAESWLHVRKSKNGDERDVPMSKRAVELLGMVPRDTAYVFPVNKNSFGTAFRIACNELGLVGLHFHDTRHEAVSRMAKVYPVLQLAAVVGHRDLKSLQVYYNPTIQELVQHLHDAGQPMPPRL
jgi:integrase